MRRDSCRVESTDQLYLRLISGPRRLPGAHPGLRDQSTPMGPSDLHANRRSHRRRLQRLAEAGRSQSYKGGTTRLFRDQTETPEGFGRKSFETFVDLQRIRKVDYTSGDVSLTTSLFSQRF